jgi:uncharacterized pyridoxamine 5'-phosphate oxidase family protein
MKTLKVSRNEIKRNPSVYTCRHTKQSVWVRSLSRVCLEADLETTEK